MPTAYFDLDKTVLGVNSATLWVRSELREGHIRWWMAARAATWIGRYQLGLARMDHAVLKAIATLEGQPEDVLAARTEAFWHREVRQTIRPQAVDAIERHRRAGDRVVLLTSSSVYLSRLAQHELGLDAILCNRFEVVDGYFTGRPEGPLCFGAGKVTHARADAEAHGEVLSAASFYTDSHSDLPVLEVVAQPVVVTPDPRLRRTAKARGWPIRDWSSA